MTFDEALRAIADLAPRGWRLGLDRMEAFVRVADLTDAVGPPRRFYHIAGTNGKGTTTAYVQALLNAHGIPAGAFFSPYVYNPRERVQGPNGLIPEQDFVTLTEVLLTAEKKLAGTEWEGVTEFEFKTALGFAYWKQLQLPAVALEVGLGGRLDATNVVHPAATAIVSIGLDHVAILGNTVAEIAAEKAGIVKPGVPLILGEVPDEAEGVISGVAQELGAPIWRVGQEIQYDESSIRVQGQLLGDLEHRMRGAAMPHNFAVAAGMLAASGIELDPEAVRVAASTAACPGRYEVLPAPWGTIILDGAHNEDSARVLAEALRRDGHENLVWVTNMLHGHDPAPFARHLLPHVKEVRVVPLSFHRARTVEECATELSGQFENVVQFDRREDAFANLPPGTTALVTGSFYLLGELYPFLVANRIK